MPWDFKEAEEAEELLATALAEHRAMLYERPRPALQRLRAYCDALAELIERRDGLLAPDPVVRSTPHISDALRQAEMAAPQTPRADPEKERIERELAARISPSQNLLACSRGAHAYGAPDNRGWAKCVMCGNVSITGGLARGPGAYDMSVRHPGDM